MYPNNNNNNNNNNNKDKKINKKGEINAFCREKGIQTKPWRLIILLAFRFLGSDF